MLKHKVDASPLHGIKWATAAVALGLTASSCTTPANLSHEVSASRSHIIAHGDQIYIRSVSDKREKDARLTDMLGRAMTGADFQVWAKNGIEAHGLTIGNAATESTAKCKVDLELRRATIQAMNSSKSANIVIGARDIDTGDYKLYRGVDAGTNWASTATETNSGLSRALGKALVKLGEDCKVDES